MKCGTTLPTSPEPESWRQSGDLGQQQTQDYQSSGYSAPQTPSSGYPGYGQPQGLQSQPGGSTDWQALGANKKLAAGLCGILLGSLGVHKFILGYNTEGIIMLLITLVTCGFGAIITYIIGIVEGITYLTKSDEEFVRTYVQNKKGWF